VDVRPDAAMSSAEARAMFEKAGVESCFALTCMMPAVGGWQRPSLMFMAEGGK
jgi:hypothetical protein